MKTASEPRFASLTAGLLARKGQAKPAMRPGGSLGGCAPAMEDLGWDDMGYAAPPPPVAMPEPVRQQAEIAAVLAAAREAPADAPSSAQPIVTLPIRAAAGAKGKAAFTLRLDPERHLRLRLACAVRHQSAQVLITQALDALLLSMPALDALANACPVATPDDDRSTGGLS